MRLVRAFKQATFQTKLFWIVAIGVGILSTGLCLYPYLWFPEHRSTTEVKP